MKSNKLIAESEVEIEALEVLNSLGYQIISGPEISPDSLFAERKDYSQVILSKKLEEAIDRINPVIPVEGKEDAIKKLKKIESQSLAVDNKDFHRLLTDGIDAEFLDEDNNVKSEKVWLIDFKNIENNSFLAVNQFTIIENNKNRRPDIVIFVNGLPLALFELKNPTDEKATIRSAYNQLETYKVEIPSIFKYNEILVISDGLGARAGTLTSKFERFMPWKTIDGINKVGQDKPLLDVLLKGVFNKEILLDIIRNFIVFEIDRENISKKLAAYHQYHSTNRAVGSTIKASSSKGDRRAGVVWHTQGSGKSLTMVFYAGKIIQELNNPTLVVITDRNDLDDQLFGTFSSCQQLLRQKPVQADSREHLQELLKVSSGGVVFTTIQKFFPDSKDGKYPMLSERSNIVVIADEAHRSQYDFIDGFARHMRDALPNASFIGFTGTPLEKVDRNTPAVFGNYIDIYDVEQAIEDGNTVRIYYESRLAKVKLNEKSIDKIDFDFEEITEAEEETVKDKLKNKWARLEAIVGSQKRLKLIAEDIVSHFEDRQKTIEGKAMVVGMSRRICIDLYREIVKLRPQWHDPNPQKGQIKVVITGSASDPVSWQEHIYNKSTRKELAERFKDPADPFKIAIVRDMWLTGFDVPPLHTMYIDKPMKGHGLMQTIARVNRVYKDKPGGLIVDYIGIADELKKALSKYTESGGRGEPVLDKDKAIAVMKEKYEIIKGIIHKFKYGDLSSMGTKEKSELILSLMDYVIADEDRRKRFLKYSNELSKAFSLAVPSKEALKIRDEVGLFQAVRVRIKKTSSGNGGYEDEEVNLAIKQIVSDSTISVGMVDVFSEAGLKKPDVSIISDKFLEDVKKIKHRNLAVELLKKLVNDEIKERHRKNVVESEKFSKMLEKTIDRYNRRTITAAMVIEELIELAKKINKAKGRGEELGFSEDELAFYDALETNESAVRELGDEVLRKIAKELAEIIKKNVTIDWTLRENVQAKLRVLVKRILRKYNYPPDKQKKATETVLKQAKVLCEDWAG